MCKGHPCHPRDLRHDGFPSIFQRLVALVAFVYQGAGWQWHFLLQNLLQASQLPVGDPGRWPVV